jgi:hypothetical protein
VNGLVEAVEGGVGGEDAQGMGELAERDEQPAPKGGSLKSLGPSSCAAWRDRGLPAPVLALATVPLASWLP